MATKKTVPPRKPTQVPKTSMGVRINSGEFPLLRNYDPDFQPHRALIWTKWRNAFRGTGSVQPTLDSIEDIIDDVITYRMWDETDVTWADNAEEFLASLGLTDLDLERPAKITRDLKNEKSDLRKEIRAREKEARRKHIEALRAEGYTQEQIAKGVGLSQRRVGQILENKSAYTPKTSKKREQVAYKINSGTSPATAAQRIRETFGDAYAEAVAAAITAPLNRPVTVTTKPVPVETKTVIVKTQPVKVEAKPVTVKTKAVPVEAKPVTVKPKRGLEDITMEEFLELQNQAELRKIAETKERYKAQKPYWDAMAKATDDHNKRLDELEAAGKRARQAVMRRKPEGFRQWWDEQKRLAAAGDHEAQLVLQWFKGREDGAARGDANWQGVVDYINGVVTERPEWPRWG